MSKTCKEVVEETATRLETGPVYQAAKDLIDRYFKNTDKCLASIPARPDVDADLVLMTGLERAAALIRALEARAEKAERERDEALDAECKQFEEAMQAYRAFGGRFTLTMPDGGDVKLHEAVISAMSALNASEARVKALEEALNAAHCYIDASEPELREWGKTRSDLARIARAALEPKP
jgi:hypothetical protein